METPDLYSSAKKYAKLGLPIIPLAGKIPALKEWQWFAANAVNLCLWWGKRDWNIGLRTGESGYIVIDTDTEEAEAWVEKHCPDTPMQAVTGAGSRHRFFGRPPRKEIRNSQGLHGIPGLDVRGHAGFIVLAPSRHPETGKPYLWTGDIRRPDELPRFSPEWVYKRTRKQIHTAVALDGDRGQLLSRARLYMAKIEPAVSGQGGHTKSLTTARKLACFVGYDEELLWVLLQEYSDRCVPPWSERELRHKLSEAMKEKC